MKPCLSLVVPSLFWMGTLYAAPIITGPKSVETSDAAVKESAPPATQGVENSQSTPAPSSENPAPLAPNSQASESPEVQHIKKQLEEIKLMQERLNAEIALRQAKQTAELAERKEAIALKQLEIEEIKAELELNELKRKKEAESQLAKLRTESELAQLKHVAQSMRTEAEVSEIKRVETTTKHRSNMIDLELQYAQKQEQARMVAEKGPDYLEEPLIEEKVLVISDRRIPLNGPIVNSTADKIADQIAYFNNKDPKKPIFIVIDNSPGGSVMAGYKILKAMEGSEAPVHVVVKSFAASMAATICTLADRSYAYPNAVILHHQISWFSSGNLTQHREGLKSTEEWWKRLAEPIAMKMGVTLEELVKTMYEKNSAGDWEEFADNAQKLKWVDHIVEEIRETSQIAHPENGPKAQVSLISRDSSTEQDPLGERVDAKGQPYVQLPRLQPMDAYWIYNPDGYYR